VKKGKARVGISPSWVILPLAMWIALWVSGASVLELSIFFAAIALFSLAILDVGLSAKERSDGPEPSERHSLAPVDHMIDAASRINALESQINPHFLYNTLESIRGQALTEGATEIAATTEALASFFRYNISSKGRIVPLRDELNNINNYFLIQAYRFGDKCALDLNVDADDDEDVYEYLVPKLSIQPIVENAIFHGLEPKGEKGRVSISITPTRKRLLIVVSDDGIGMRPEALEEINDSLETGLLAEVRASGEPTGIALPNVNERIKLLFGQGYGLRVYSTYNRGTDVEITLPLVKDIALLDEVIQ
jgi:two-component system sensor histidine kinase YesM